MLKNECFIGESIKSSQCVFVSNETTDSAIASSFLSVNGLTRHRHCDVVFNDIKNKSLDKTNANLTKYYAIAYDKLNFS